jgi:hypothetical protein
VEAQLTAERDWGAETTVDPVHGSAARLVSTIRPAVGEDANVDPTATQVPTAVQDTSASAADEVVTVWVVQTAPPLSDESRTPRPERALSRLVAVVPTTVQWAPATPTVGTGAVVGGVVVAGGAVVVGAAVVLVVVGAAGAAVEAGAAVVVGATVVVGAAVVVGATVVVGMAPLPEVGPARHEMPSR